MGTEGVLSPRMLGLLLWVQLCSGKCQFHCPTAQAQQYQHGHRDLSGNGVSLQVLLR